MTKPCLIDAGQPMKRRQGKHGKAFYSHQVPGGWCSGRPK